MSWNFIITCTMSMILFFDVSSISINDFPTKIRLSHNLSISACLPLSRFVSIIHMITDLIDGSIVICHFKSNHLRIANEKDRHHLHRHRRKKNNHFFMFLWLSNHWCITLLMKDTDPFVLTSFSDIRKYLIFFLTFFHPSKSCHKWIQIAFFLSKNGFFQIYNAVIAVSRSKDRMRMKMYGIDEILRLFLKEGEIHLLLYHIVAIKQN